METKCPRCHHRNRHPRRYCARCGSPLSRTCGACGFVNEGTEDYCGGCGNALSLGPATAPGGRESGQPERRQLTVMFCDLVGSTVLSQQLDPEDLREVIRGYQSSATQVIARYDGFVARYMGDGMLVYFGFPRAHEDDAARAIDAGLKIVESLHDHAEQGDPERGADLGVRVGIATGAVVVGDLIGEGASAEAPVVGATPNLAARLQAIAKPNTVVVAQLTRQLAGNLFDYADEGTRKLKGFDQPVRAWRVSRAGEAASRFDAARTGRLTPLVGREAELAVLLQHWQRATAGAGQMVVLFGEAGIGKSRLAAALGERIASQSPIQLRYQCSPYHTNSVLHPFIQQLERVADFKAKDTPQQKLDKLTALVAKWTVKLDESVPLFSVLLSLPASERYPPLHMSPDQQKERTLGALLERLRGLAARAPVLVLFEDVQWIDPTSRELLHRLAHDVQGLRALVVITSRSAPEHTWVDVQHTCPLRIDRLDRQDAATMVRRFLGRKQFPVELIDQIVAKTDGVPLFIEELTRTLATTNRGRRAVATRASGAGIPSTLQDSLMARLDQLGPVKEVAQTAAVIGREFSCALLASISGWADDELRDALSTLTFSSIVADCGEPAWTSFMFKHALLQDVAYASLLKSKRRELHGRIAATLEETYPERVAREPEVVAHHYTEAGQFLAAAKYWAAAGRRALDQSANLEAVAHASQGRELLSSIAPGAERDELELGLEMLRGTAYRAIKGFASLEVERSFTRARELSERLDDKRARVDSLRGLFSCFYARGALASAREQGEQVAALGGKLGDSSSRMLGRWMLGCVAFWQGEFPTARRELEEAFSLYKPEEHRGKMLALQIDPGVNALFHLSCALWILGYPDQAVRTSDKAVHIARELAQPFALAMALFFACRTRACCGHDVWVRQLLEELTELTAKHGLGYLHSCARVLEAQALIEQNQCVAGLEQVERAFSEFRTQEAGVALTWARSISASAYARLGRGEAGLAIVAEAFEAAERNGEHHWEAELWRLKGDLLLLAPACNEGEVEACFRRAIDVAQRQQAKSLELRASMSLARLLERQDKAELARRVLGQVCDWFTEGFDTIDLRQARSALNLWPGGGSERRAAAEAGRS